MEWSQIRVKGWTALSAHNLPQFKNYDEWRWRILLSPRRTVNVTEDPCANNELGLNNENVRISWFTTLLIQNCLIPKLCGNWSSQILLPQMDEASSWAKRKLNGWSTLWPCCESDLGSVYSQTRCPQTYTSQYDIIMTTCFRWFPSSPCPIRMLSSVSNLPSGLVSPRCTQEVAKDWQYPPYTSRLCRAWNQCK